MNITEKQSKMTTEVEAAMTLAVTIHTHMSSIRDRLQRIPPEDASGVFSDVGPWVSILTPTLEFFEGILATIEPTLPEVEKERPVVASPPVLTDLSVGAYILSNTYANIFLFVPRDFKYSLRASEGWVLYRVGSRQEYPVSDGTREALLPFLEGTTEVPFRRYINSVYWDEFEGQDVVSTAHSSCISGIVWMDTTTLLPDLMVGAFLVYNIYSGRFFFAPRPCYYSLRRIDGWVLCKVGKQQRYPAPASVAIAVSEALLGAASEESYKVHVSPAYWGEFEEAARCGSEEG